ncbi:hypothetical protein ACFLXQ_03445 [Chloroflexota bacterium]
MAKLRNLEQQAQEAILRYTIENYKQQRENWLDEPAIKKAVLVHSFFRLENAVLIAAAILATGCLPLFLFPLLGFSSLVWLGAIIPLFLGIMAEIFYLFFTFRNEKLQAKAVAGLFEPEFQPARIIDRDLKAKTNKALEYWSLIDESVGKVPKGVLRDRLLKTTREVAHWLQAVYNLAERVDKFRLNRVIAQDLKNVPQAIETYERRLAREDNPDVRQQLQKTIADRKRQLKTLENLQTHIEKAAYQLDSTISSLGTIYSQLLLVDTKDEQGGRINRLQKEISEQVYQLEDLAEAMDEVYQSSV